VLDLMPHQADGIRWLKERERALLADEPGLGKTIQLIAAGKEPFLVVAPAMVLESGTWDDEIAKWFPGGVDVTQVSYSSLVQRGPKGKIFRDQFGFPTNPPKPEYMKHWRTLICDESHYLKGRKTSWTKAVRDVADLSDEIELATGTPIPNWAQEAFTTLQILYPEEAKAGRRFGSFWRWAGEWFHIGKNRFNAREIGDLKTADHIAHCSDCEGSDPRAWEEFRSENWGDRFLMRYRKDVLKDLPPMTSQIWRVKMTREQERIYKTLRKDYIAWLESGQEIAIWSEPGLLVKLAQCATGLEVLGEGTKGSGKLDALRSILADRPRPTLAVAHFQASVEASASAARDLGLRVGVVHGGRKPAERTAAIRGFQRGDLDVLCASIGTISEGVTLHQSGCDQIVRLERSFTPSKNDQVDRRIHRIGQVNSCSVIDIVTEGTVDERVLELLELKTDQQMNALGQSDMAFLAA
jgi:SNF2 family DNA or RNA helicase